MQRQYSRNNDVEIIELSEEELRGLRREGERLLIADITLINDTLFYGGEEKTTPVQLIDPSKNTYKITLPRPTDLMGKARWWTRQIALCLNGINNYLEADAYILNKTGKTIKEKGKIKVVKRPIFGKTVKYDVQGEISNLDEPVASGYSITIEHYIEENPLLVNNYSELKKALDDRINTILNDMRTKGAFISIEAFKEACDTTPKGQRGKSRRNTNTCNIVVRRLLNDMETRGFEILNRWISNSGTTPTGGGGFSAYDMVSLLLTIPRIRLLYQGMTREVCRKLCRVIANKTGRLTGGIEGVHSLLSDLIAKYIFEHQPISPGRVKIRLRIYRVDGKHNPAEDKIFISSILLASVLTGLGALTTRGFGKFFIEGIDTPYEDLKKLVVEEKSIKDIVESCIMSMANILGVSNILSSCIKLEDITVKYHPCPYPPRIRVGKHPCKASLNLKGASGVIRNIMILSAIGYSSLKISWKMNDPANRYGNVRWHGDKYHTWVLGLPRSQSKKGYTIISSVDTDYDPRRRSAIEMIPYDITNKPHLLLIDLEVPKKIRGDYDTVFQRDELKHIGKHYGSNAIRPIPVSKVWLRYPPNKSNPRGHNKPRYGVSDADDAAVKWIRYLLEV